MFFFVLNTPVENCCIKIIIKSQEEESCKKICEIYIYADLFKWYVNIKYVKHLKKPNQWLFSLVYNLV